MGRSMSTLLNLDLLLGAVIAALFLMAYYLDDEFNREVRLESGIDLIPGGEAILILVIFAASPLFPIAVADGVLRGGGD
jgi:hypothetical protein